MGPEPVGHEEELLPIGVREGFRCGGFLVRGTAQGSGRSGPGILVGRNGFIQGEKDLPLAEEVKACAPLHTRHGVDEGEVLPFFTRLHDPVPQDPEALFPVAKSGCHLEPPGPGGLLHSVAKSLEGCVGTSVQEGHHFLHPQEVVLAAAPSRAGCGAISEFCPRAPGHPGDGEKVELVGEGHGGIRRTVPKTHQRRQLSEGAGQGSGCGERPEEAGTVGPRVPGGYHPGSGFPADPDPCEAAVAAVLNVEPGPEGTDETELPEDRFEFVGDVLPLDAGGHPQNFPRLPLPGAEVGEESRSDPCGLAHVEEFSPGSQEAIDPGAVLGFRLDCESESGPLFAVCSGHALRISGFAVGHKGDPVATPRAERAISLARSCIAPPALPG